MILSNLTADTQQVLEQKFDAVWGWFLTTWEATPDWLRVALFVFAAISAILGKLILPAIARMKRDPYISVRRDD